MQDALPRDQVVSVLVLPLPMIAVLALSLAVAGHRVLALCLLPPILAAGTYLRRFGPAGVRVGPQLFNGYLFGFLLGSVITLGDTGWLAAEIGVGILVAIVVKVGVFHDTSTQALRRTQRSYRARTRRLASLALVAFDKPGPWSSRRLHRQKTRLGEAAQVIDGQLADPGAAPGRLGRGPAPSAAVRRQAGPGQPGPVRRGAEPFTAARRPAGTGPGDPRQPAGRPI